MGEAAHWGEDINGEPLDRLLGPGGRAGEHADVVRRSDRLTATCSTSTASPTRSSSTPSSPIAQANQHIDQLPLYDPLDDDSVEAFRRRFLTTRSAFRRCRRPPIGRRAATWSPQFDERLVRPADRPARLGHLAEHGNRRRPDGHPAWASSSGGRPSAARPTTATSSTGSRWTRT